MMAIESLPELKNLGANNFVASQALFYMRSAQNKGIQLTPDKLARFVHRDFVKMVNSYLGAQKEDVLEREIEPTFWQKWDKHKQGKVATPNQPSQVAPVPQSAPNATDPDKTWDDVWGTRDKYKKNIAT